MESYWREEWFEGFVNVKVNVNEYGRLGQPLLPSSKPKAGRDHCPQWPEAGGVFEGFKNQRWVRTHVHMRPRTAGDSRPYRGFNIQTTKFR